MSSSLTIRISRNQNIAKDRSIAILKLNKLTHYEGQPVMVKYWSNSGKIDTLLALGIKDGIGEDCYKIISLSGLELVRGVVSTLPDVSLLVHGELYLYRDPDKIWNYVYASDGIRIVEPITNLEPTTFVNIKDKFRWFWDGSGKLKREDDFSSSEEMLTIINELFLKIGSPKLTVISEIGYLFHNNQTVNIPLRTSIIDALGNDLAGLATFYINGKKVDKDEDNKIIIIGANKNNTNYLIEAKIIANSHFGREYTYTAAVLIDFGYNFYYGRVNNDWEITSNNVINLENIKLNAKNSIEYNSINLNYQKIVFSYPKIYGYLSHIIDEHGLDHIEDYNVFETEISSIKYLVYIKINAININNFDQKFLFVDEDEDAVLQGSFDEAVYDEIVVAWGRRNTSNGLIQLNDEGKIPDYLLSTTYEITSEFSFASIINFLDYYPEKLDLKTGDKWYNTVEKTIFEATGINSGVIYSPKENTIYLNNTDKSLYLWKSGEMILISETITSKPITNVIEILD